MEINLNPGPIDSSLLHSNREHRATFLFNGSLDSTKSFTVRRMDEKFWSVVHKKIIHERVRHYIGVTGFGGFFSVGKRRLDNSLVTALVERWRPETHTFHFPRIGEATVTLQDIQILWGFNVTGNVVTGIDFKLSNEQWRMKCEMLLGFLPSSTDVQKGSIKMSCLLRVIGTELPDYPSEEDYMTRARVFILHMIGGSLFPNTSGNKVPLFFLQNIEDLEISGNLSWGDVSDICGPLGLLQLWAWVRIRSLAPTVTNRHYNFAEPYGARFEGEHSDRSFSGVTSHVLAACRSQLTSLTTHEFNWVPYEDILHSLPPCCRRDPENWRCETYLVCWEIVEPHPVTRVMRQFGMFQNVPDAPLFNHNDCVREHSVSRLGKSNHNWEAEQGVYIDRWHERHESIQTSFLVNDYTPSPEYIAWFHPRTVQYIANPGSTPHGFQPLGEQREFQMDGMTRWHNESVDQGDENLSQQYMSYMHNNERFSHEPSNYVENYDPVPQQMFQRDTRRRRQPRSNVDDAGPSSVIKQKKTHF